MAQPVRVTSLAFRSDLMLRELAGSSITRHDSHLVIRTSTQPGLWWGNFVLFGAPPRAGDAAGWAEVFRREFPGAAHLALGIDGTDGDLGDPRELARLGVAAQVSTVLTATRVPCPGQVDEGVTIRPLTSNDDWRQALGLRLACEGDGPLPVGHRRFFLGKLVEYRSLCTAGHGIWLGAFVDGRLRSDAGLFCDSRGPALIQNVKTHPAYRRRGLASSVVHRLAHRGLHEFGARTLVLTADPRYHAVRIYRSLGFTEVERQVRLHRASPRAGNGRD